MNKLLTIEDLMERWQLCESTIRNYLRDGVITKIEGIPQIRFSEDYISSIEHQLNEGKTYREICLEKQIEKLKAENTKLSGIIGKAVGELTGVWRG